MYQNYQFNEYTCEPSDYASLKLMSFKHVHEYFSVIRFFKYYKLN